MQGVKSFIKNRYASTDKVLVLVKGFNVRPHFYLQPSEECVDFLFYRIL